MKLKHAANVKTKLSSTLKSWFPILQGSTIELEEILNSFIDTNPFVEIKSNIQLSISQAKKNINKKQPGSKYMSDKIESLSIYEKSIYEILDSQIIPPLFPTPISQKIAYTIIDNINSDGYFEGDIEEIAKQCEVDKDMVEKIRLRFAKLDPSGVGAKDWMEAMYFSLESYDLEDELYDLIINILSDLNGHTKYRNHELYYKAIKVIKRIKGHSIFDYSNTNTQIIPDIFINATKDGFEVSLNDAYYPDIYINKANISNQMIKTKIKEANDLIDALAMRKATIKKIGLMVLEYQYDFFMGGEIKPMKLKDIAKDLGHSPSTISRAVSNKYLECNRGIFPLKKFFTTAINDDTSNASIKNFIDMKIKEEDRLNPLSDMQLLEIIENTFDVKMVRRTITKYRKQLDIPSSNERKKLYQIII